ncbi:MAG: DUF2207 domain-containing protein [bacterium]
MKSIYHFLLISFIFLLSSAVYADKSYRMSKVQIRAQLQADGSMEVSEYRTYDFEDDFSYAYRTFPKSDTVSFTNFSITENNRKYILSDTQEPGTFWIKDKKSYTEVRWFFRAEDEKRTFTVRYTVNDAVVRFRDAAVLHYQFIGKEWDKSSWNVTLELIPPVSLSPQEVKVWPHGPLWMESYIQNDGIITGSCRKIPAHTFFDIRALYPISIFLQSKYVDKAVKENILKEEAKWALEANQKREKLLKKERARKKRWAQGKWIMGILSLIGLMGWGVFFQKYGTRPSLQRPVPEVSPNIPSETPPALLDYLLHNRDIYGGAIMGTLFDLAGKGIISLRHEEQERSGLKKIFSGKTSRSWNIDREKWRKQKAQLQDYENTLLEFLFDTIGKGENSVDIKLIKKKRNSFMKFFRDWKKTVKRKGDKKGWFDKQSFKGRNYAFMIAGVLLLLSIPGFILYEIWGFILTLSSLLIFILSTFIAHRTREGEQLAREWKALKKYLHKHHYRNADNQYILDRIDEYLIYSVVLGVNQKTLKELAGFIPSDNHAAYIPWFIYHGHAGEAFSSASFAASFSASVAATTSAMSSAAGAGGGAAGGAGGASGGGGGAG